MASIDPSLISDPREHKWVVEIRAILNRQLEVNDETPSVSLFQVPETMITKKPEAYEPQQIGLGPIHHFRSQPYKKMEQKKLAVMRKVLQDYEIKDPELTVLNKVRKLVPILRSCYDMFLQGDDESLVWIFAIDGLFLLNLFDTYNSGIEKEKEEYLLFLQKKAYELKLATEKAYALELAEAKAYELKRAKAKAYELKLSAPKIMASDSFSHSIESQTKIDVMSENHGEEKTESDDFPSPVGPQTEIFVNLENKTTEIMESYDLPPVLREKEIVVTAENQTEWEWILNLPPHQPELPKVGPRKRLMAQDIMMVENQIPFMVLEEINEALHPSSGNSSSSTNKFSPSIFETFCKIHSPLKLCSKSQAPTSVDHLLHYMYYSIVNNVPVEKPGDQLPDSSHKKVKEDAHRIEPQYNRSEEKSSIINVYNLITKVPQKEIVQAYEQTISILENFSQSKILIPSASTLHDKAGFMFYSLAEDKGIQNIGIHGKDICLPSITLNKDSEVILRNLVAYETLTVNSDNFPLTEYIGLMCALIVNKEDVKVLENVIKGDLGADEVAKLFIGMSSSIPNVKTKGKSKLREVIDEVNKVYESRLRMKTYLLLKKLAHWLLVVLRAIGGFVESSWKVVAFIVSIVTVFLLTSQAYCNVYSCAKTTVTLLPYASS